MPGYSIGGSYLSPVGVPEASLVSTELEGVRFLYGVLKMDVNYIHSNHGRRVGVTLKKGVLHITTASLTANRHESVIFMLHEAAKRLSVPDTFFSHFTVSIHDKGDEEMRAYAFSTTRENKELYFPAPFFKQWPRCGVSDYSTAINDIVSRSVLPPSVRKIFWIGELRTHITRFAMYEIGKKNELCDFRSLIASTVISKDEEDHYIGTDGYVPMVDFCRFSALLDIQGWGFSGRLPFLLATGRPIVVCDRLYEQEYYFDTFRPWVHFIPAKEDLSDLEERIAWVFANYDEAREIGLAGQRYALENLTQDKMIDRAADVFKANENPAAGHIKPVLLKRGKRV